MATSDSGKPSLDNDAPLDVDTALPGDKLGRLRFAEAAVSSLLEGSSASGLVMSIEGPWGSGKTSTLAMIEALLQKVDEPTRPLVAFFNPWLVGDRDALLRQFLAKLASTVELSDNAKEGSRVAKQLTAYSKTFDLLKFIPGAEPWASMVGGVVKAAGEAVGAVSEDKTLDLEKRKEKVEEALRTFPRRIVVFIDDVDRLFAAEVFEVIRIIKAIGALPNVSYVVAWDASYVAKALETASVPFPQSYLEKIVQVRMPLPTMSSSARSELVDAALRTLDAEALDDLFPGCGERLPLMYAFGLQDVLEQPRDIVRLFNTLKMVEPPLRGEIVFADILGLAALIIKAPDTLELLKKNPRWFVGRPMHEGGLPGRNSDVISEGNEARSSAYNRATSPSAVKKLVNALFPRTAKADGSTPLGNAEDMRGHLAAPARLAVALQAQAGEADVSLRSVRRYLTEADERPEIEKTLTKKNASQFVSALGSFAETIQGRGIVDLEALAVAMARLGDHRVLVDQAANRSPLTSLPVELAVGQALEMVVKSVAASKGPGPQLAATIIRDPESLTIAAELLDLGFHDARRDDDRVVLPSLSEVDALSAAFAQNVLTAATSTLLFERANPGRVLWTLARVAKPMCKQVFAEIKKVDPTLDAFVLQLLRRSVDSNKGQTYAIPTEVDMIEPYVPLEVLRAHAAVRLNDETMGWPARAAWMSVVDGNSYYGVDGTRSRR